MTGWVKLPRSTQNHAALQNATRRGLFDRLYLMAERQPRTKEWRGSTLNLARGQTVISVRDFAAANEVGYKEARLHLAKLARARLISLETVRGACPGAQKGAIGTLVTVHFEWLLGVTDDVQGASLGAVNGAAEGAIGAQEGRNRGAPVLGEGENLEPNHEDSESCEPSAAPPLPDLKAAIWRAMVGLLGPSSRSLVGRWARDYGDAAVFEAYNAYRAAVAGGEKAEPRAYLVAILEHHAGKRGGDRSPMASHRRVMSILGGEQPPPTESERRSLALYYAERAGETIQ